MIDFDIYASELRKTGKLYINSEHSDWKDTAEKIIEHFGEKRLKVDWVFNGVSILMLY